MVEKTLRQQRLDDIVSGNIEKPKLVEILRLPDIDEWQQGKLVTHWDVDEAFFTVGQSLFGGYIGCLADQVLSHTALTVLDEKKLFRTITLNVDFFNPIVKGRLDIEGSILHHSKSRIHGQVELRQKEQLMARAYGVQQLSG